MTDIGKLNLSLDLKTDEFDQNLNRAQRRAAEAGGLMAGAFDSVESAITQIGKSISGKISEELKLEAERSQSTVRRLTDLSQIDFSSRSGIDLSPLTKEAEKIRERLKNPLTDIFSDVFKGKDPFEIFTPFEPSSDEDIRRGIRRRSRPDYGGYRTEERSTNGSFDNQSLDLQARRNISATEIGNHYSLDGPARWNPVAYQEARLREEAELRRSGDPFKIRDDYNSAIYANLDYRYSRFRENNTAVDHRDPEFIGSDFDKGPVNRNKVYEDSLIDSLYVGTKERKPITLPRVDEEGLIRLTEFFNQTKNIESSTSTLVGFIAAWNEMLVSNDVAAEKFGLTDAALQSIRDTMRSLSAESLTNVTGYFNSSDDIDDNTNSIQEFTEAWNQAMVRSKEAAADANLASEMANIGTATQQASSELQNLINYEGRRNDRSRLGRGVERAESIFDAAKNLVLEPRFTGGEVMAKRLYSVAEHGPELGKFGDRMLMFQKPTMIRPRVQGTIFNASETKRLLQELTPRPIHKAPKISLNQAPSANPNIIVKTDNASISTNVLTTEIKALRKDLQKAIALSGNTYILNGNEDQALDTIASLRTLDMSLLVRRGL